ncbi:hypothetical protein BDV59DRAFT_205432 [Aspergillus ambiguus]|uniref:uncharacterized protein n=1 Tax=Aspergillus ambiguus TaxID=176160 RepID=UPI003CCD8921
MEATDHPLQMYHRYKHQRATQHLIELYEADRNGDGAEGKAAQAIFQLDKINTRIREINQEYELPERLGIIDYGAFLYGWNRQEDRALRDAKFEAFCRRNHYMKGWSYLPPRRMYDYFNDRDGCNHTVWESITAWLKLIWILLRQQGQSDIIDELETKLCKHAGDMSDQFDGPFVLSKLHSMSRLLHAQYSAILPSAVIEQYEGERTLLQRMCNFNGFPAQWIPGNYHVERLKVCLK